jgi:hypothetical protein
MRFSLTGLVRLVGFLGVLTCAVAVALARFQPTPAHFRLATPPHYGVINGFVLHPAPGDLKFLDAETGRFCPVRLPEGDRLDYGSCSPWEDEDGEYQVVGRWSHREPGTGREFGLARYSLPSGRVLDYVPLNVMPAGHPCWFPGTAARVIFAGADGRLYHVRFEGSGSRAGGGDLTGEEPRVEPVDWRCPAPGSRLLIRDPVWPTDPRLGGRLIVSLSYRLPGDDQQLSAGRLWWLKLSADGKAVVEAGPMTEPVRDSAWNHGEERFPNLAVTPDGRLTLAYLWHAGPEYRWDLRLAPIGLDPKTGAPRLRAGDARTVTTGHLGEVPPFSADGRHVFAIVFDGLDDERALLVRYPTTPSDPRAAADQPSARAPMAAGG